MQRLYCYADETGQDTLGRFFLVAVVITEQTVKDQLSAKLTAIETRTGKGLSSWRATGRKRRFNYLREVSALPELARVLFAVTYHQETRPYTVLTAEAVARALTARTTSPYKVTIIVDGLTPTETERFVKELKRHRIRYEQVKGMRDEQEVFLRLADAFAGFLRDVAEQSPYLAQGAAVVRKAQRLVHPVAQGEQ